MPVTCSHLQSVGTPKGWEWACTLSPLLPLLSLSLWVCVRGDSACSRGGREDPIACTVAALGVAGGRKHCLRRVVVSGLPAGAGRRGAGPGPGCCLESQGSSLLPLPWPYRSLSTGRLTDLLLKAAFGTQAPDSGSTDSLPEKPMEISACGPGSRGPKGPAVPRQQGPEPLLSLSQRPLLASEGTWSPEPVLGGPAALPLWCSPWARPRVGPRRPRAPAPGCSQVRTVTGPLAGGTMLDLTPVRIQLHWDGRP